MSSGVVSKRQQPKANKVKKEQEQEEPAIDNEDEKGTASKDLSNLKKMAYSKGGIILLIILVSILFYSLHNLDRDISRQRRIPKKSTNDFEAATTAPSTAEPTDSEEQAAQKKREQEQEQEDKNLQSGLVFEVDVETIGILQQHNPFMVVLLHKENITSEVESAYSETAKNVSIDRHSTKNRLILFTTAEVNAENEHVLKELGVLTRISESSPMQSHLVLFSKQRIIEAAAITREFLTSPHAIQDFVDMHTKRSIEELRTKEEVSAYLNDKSSKRVLIGSNNSTLIELLRTKEKSEDILSANGVARVKLITDLSLLSEEATQNLLGNTAATFPFIAFLKDDKFPKESEVSYFTNAQIDEIEEIKEFIQIETLDLIYKMNPQNYMDIFASPILNQIHLFLDPQQDNSKIIEQFSHAALYNKESELKYERMVFVIEEFSEETKEFMSLFDVTSKEQLPVLAISVLDYSAFGFMKYVYNSKGNTVSEESEEPQKNEVLVNDLSSAQIIEFGENARKKAIAPHYRSEPIPDSKDSDGIVKLVGKNFKESVIKTPISYFVLFHDSKDPKSVHEYLEFLKEFILTVPKEQYEKLIKIATFDLNKNEVEYLNIDAAPKLVVYPHFYKQNPQAYKGPLKVETISKFLNQWVRDLNLLGLSQTSSNSSTKPAAAAAAAESKPEEQVIHSLG